MAFAPGFLSSRVDWKSILKRPGGEREGGNVTLTSGMTSSTASPTSRIPPGMVVVKRTSTGKYLPATDVNGDRNSAAVVVSDEAADADWASKSITVTVNGKSATVALAAGDDTTAEVVTALNADSGFAALATASGTNGNPVTVTSREKGADVHMNVAITTISTAFGTAAVGKNDAGADADYRIVAEYADMLDRTGAAQEPSVKTLLAGVFERAAITAAVDGSGNSTLTGEAEVVLGRRGCLFE